MNESNHSGIRKVLSFQSIILILILCSVSLYGFAATAQETEKCSIEGTVKDPLGNVIPGANVLLEELSLIQTTDGEGHFCFPEAPSHPFNLLVTYKGFANEWVKNVEPGSTDVAVVIHPADLRESITVTAATPY